MKFRIRWSDESAVYARIGPFYNAHLVEGKMDKRVGSLSFINDFTAWRTGANCVKAQRDYRRKCCDGRRSGLGTAEPDHRAIRGGAATGKTHLRCFYGRSH